MTLSTIASVPLYAATRVTGSDPPLHASLIDIFVTLFCTAVLTCNFLSPEGCSDECLNHQCECPNGQQMSKCYNLNSSGGMEHYSSKEVTFISNTWASHLKHLSMVWRKKTCYFLPRLLLKMLKEATFLTGRYNISFLEKESTQWKHLITALTWNKFGDKMTFEWIKIPPVQHLDEILSLTGMMEVFFSPLLREKGLSKHLSELRGFSSFECVHGLWSSR